MISPEFKYKPCDVLISKDGMYLVTIVEFFEIDGKKKVEIKIKPAYLNHQREIQETHDLAYLEGCEPYYIKNNNENYPPPSTTKS